MADEHDPSTREQLGPGAEPEWVRDMREHFERTGTYRAEDLHRVLGDPADRVEIGPDPNHPVSCTRR
jgi:hypothetical protein